VRIYAEDPFSGFLPSAGEMILNHLPDSPGVRLDSAFTGAARVSSSFDPMIAKITVHSGNRKDAIVKMRKYLGECAIHGIKTNLEYLYWIFEEEDFSSNQISTRYCENKAELLKNLNLSFRKKIKTEYLLAASLIPSFYKAWQNTDVWKSLGALRFPGKRVYNIGDVPLKFNTRFPVRENYLFT
ncbi:MAG: hypothetical protein HC830_05805, partial [Bacteroidetes bacterium]|nr:hypothetical protein [Bacteroidota bacterium]